MVTEGRGGGQLRADPCSVPYTQFAERRLKGGGDEGDDDDDDDDDDEDEEALAPTASRWRPAAPSPSSSIRRFPAGAQSRASAGPPALISSAGARRCRQFAAAIRQSAEAPWHSRGRDCRAAPAQSEW